MMKRKRYLTVLLIGLAVGITLTGCKEARTGSDSGVEDTEESYTVVMGYIGDKQPDEEMIEAEINKILEPELNARLDLRAFSWSGYQQELQMILSGDAQLDIVPVIISHAAGYVSNDQLIDLTDLIDQYGTNIKSLLDEDFIHCPRVGDMIYGVTTMREHISWEGIIMRADILEELGYQVEDNRCSEFTSIEQLDELFARVKEAYPDMVVLASTAGSTPLFRWEVFDILTDGFGVLMDYGQSVEVVNLYETEAFVEFANRLYEWNQKGYLAKDAATTTESLQNQVKSGAAFAYFTPQKVGAVEQDELATGYDLAMSAVMGDPFTTSYSINFMTYGIADNSGDPKKAFQVFDYMYGSSKIMNLLNWGIEDVHYQVIDDEKGAITYADGVTAETTGYLLNQGWQLPNQEIAYVWEGESSDKWEVQREYVAAAERSKAFGFSYDTSVVSLQLTALNNVKYQYFDAIGSGSVNPAEVLDEFNQALYDSGLQDVIDEKQKQLDEWLANK